MNPLSRLLARLTFLRWLALLVILAGAASAALAGKTYSDNGDGTVTDPTTGLVWMRCAMPGTWLGQNWTGTNCPESAGEYFTWAQANALTGTVTFAGHGDWRLPNIRELQTIVDRSVSNPAIDSWAFPRTTVSATSSRYWSSTLVSPTLALDPEVYSAWFVNFRYGSSLTAWGSGYQFAVRMVRGGQSSGLLDVARPSTDYVDHSDGTITHTPTRLMWQRCPVGQSWTGSACSGTASTFISRDAASLAGQTDWRLPTADELISLADYSGHVDVNLFPVAPRWHFFSQSRLFGYGLSWTVMFYTDGGYVSYDSGGDVIRLVRAGQCFGPLVLSISKTGAGQIARNMVAGIECDTGASGYYGYYAGDLVTLTASPAVNLIEWGGACAANGTATTCIVTMDAAKTVSASFKDTSWVSGLPTTIGFPLQNIGSISAAQTVTLTNSGSAALNISSLSASGDYLISHNCGTSLAAGGFCTLYVNFKPTASGSRNGTLTLVTNAPGSPHTISLTGSGAFTAVTLSATSKTFASQYVGTTSAAQGVTLTNSGGALLNINSIVAKGGGV